MSHFILHNPPREVWQRFRTKAQLEGWSLRDLILQLLDGYASGQFVPTKPPPLTSALVRGDLLELRFTCPHCHCAMIVDVPAVNDSSDLELHTVICASCSTATVRMLPGAPTSILAVREGGDPRSNNSLKRTTRKH
jgi:hypothetical protein